MRRITREGFVIAAQTKEHERVNGKSARWIGHLIQQAQPQRRCCSCIGMQQRRRMAIVNVADSNCADLNCDGPLDCDPLIVARTVLKLSNGVAAARPPF
jgi:hypothetical protein